MNNYQVCFGLESCNKEKTSNCYKFNSFQHLPCFRELLKNSNVQSFEKVFIQKFKKVYGDNQNA